MKNDELAIEKSRQLDQLDFEKQMEKSNQTEAVTNEEIDEIIDDKMDDEKSDTITFHRVSLLLINHPDILKFRSKTASERKLQKMRGNRRNK